MTHAAELYACLYAREFPLQALLRLRPELHEKPCVTIAGKPPLQQVCSLNKQARNLGIVAGMMQVDLDTFSSAAVLQRSLKEETATRTILLECAGGFSPRVEDRSEDGVFLCVIDIAGTEKLFGAPEVLARNLLRRVKALGITGNVSISSNFFAAVLLAKGMTGRSKVQLISAGDEARALAPLPITVLDLTKARTEIFAMWGIYTLETLACLPEKELIARMGQEGKRHRQLARGELPHLFQPVEPAFTLEEHTELDSPVELLDSLLFVLGVMLDQLILRAKARVLALASVSLTLMLETSTTHERTVRPALPTNEKQLWLKLLHLDLAAHPPPAAIVALSLAAEPGDTRKVQLGLFSPQLPEPARLDVTLARIRAIVGDNCVGRAALKDTHERDGFHVEPFTLTSRPPAIATGIQPRAATRQLRPAETIFVTLQNDCPTAFVFRDRRYAVEHAYGPWMESGDWWWSSPHRDLEQWDLVACAEDGVFLCCCLTHDRKQELWQLVTLYD